MVAVVIKNANGAGSRIRARIGHRPTPDRGILFLILLKTKDYSPPMFKMIFGFDTSRSWRNTFASLLISNGEDPLLVASILGHPH